MPDARRDPTPPDERPAAMREPLIALACFALYVLLAVVLPLRFGVDSREEQTWGLIDRSPDRAPRGHR